jgi:hypothetical protein
MTYSYDPTKLTERGKDQMRFELGDTTVVGEEETCVFADEEYEGILKDLAPGKRAWMYAKLYALEAILLKLSYQVNTKIDPLTYGLGDRAEQWRHLYEQLRKQILATYGGLPSIAPTMENGPPYFYAGMEANPRVGMPGRDTFPFRNMTE